MNIKKFAKILLTALVAVMLVASVLPASALKADAIPYGTPEIDGKMDDIWSGASNKIAIDMFYEMDEKYTGDPNKYATGYARLMWDENYLYALGYAYDTTKSTNQQNTYFETDGFEVFLDERNAHNTVKNEISQIRVNRNGRLSGMLMSESIDEAGILAEYAGTKWAASETSDGYFTELAIPWTRIKGKAGKGTQIGIEFQLNDDCNNDSNTDFVINSEVIDKWSPITYRMMTLVSEKAEASASTDSEPEQTTSQTTSTPGTTTSNNNPTTQSTVSNTSQVTDSTESEVTTESDTESTDETVSDTDTAVDTDNEGEDEGIPKNIIIVIVIVAVVIIAAIAVCLALLLKPKKKKAVKPVQTEKAEEDNAE